MAEQLSVNIGACDESHCDSCGLCDKGALFKQAEPQINDGIMNIVLINTGVKKTICSLLDGGSGENIGTMAFLNNADEDFATKLTDVIGRLTNGKNYGLIVAAGEETRLEMIKDVKEICGTRLVVMPHVS